jgi:trk system potassium uptake protein TrkH
MSLYRQVHSLLRPVRPVVVCRHLGQLALIMAGSLVVPAAFSLLIGDQELALRIFSGALLPAVALGACARLSRGDRPLQVNEALTLAVLAFVLVAALMTYPLASDGVPLFDAWFEAISGVTTTGLTMVEEPGACSSAFLFTRSWLQWLGGLGIVVLSLALALGRVADMRRLADTASDEEGLGEGMRLHARRVVAVYPLLTSAGLLIVWGSGLPLFDALVHTLSAVSTGGFSTFTDSLARAAPASQLALLLVAFLGALPLPLFYRAYAHGAAELGRDPELRALVVAVVFTSVLLWSLGRLAPHEALLQALTAQTGTGFSTLDLAGLQPQAKWALILSMVTGAGVGSTAGGMKLLRVLILIRLLQVAILRAQMPRHAIVQPSIGAHPLETAQIEHALLLLLLFPLLIFCSWLPFLVAGYPPLDALFEVVSATATVGLSTGITGPDLVWWLKLVLTLDMLAGRVEILALLVLLYPRTWYKRRT